jgi:hypothetical protein
MTAPGLGCYCSAYQDDGTDFSDLIVFEVLP